MRGSRWLVGILPYPLVPPEPITLSYLAAEMHLGRERTAVPGPLFAHPVHKFSTQYVFSGGGPDLSCFLPNSQRGAARDAARELCTPGLDTSLDRVFEIEVSAAALEQLAPRIYDQAATPEMLASLDPAPPATMPWSLARNGRRWSGEDPDRWENTLVLPLRLVAPGHAGVVRAAHPENRALCRGLVQSALLIAEEQTSPRNCLISVYSGALMTIPVLPRRFQPGWATSAYVQGWCSRGGALEAEYRNGREEG